MIRYRKILNKILKSTFFYPPLAIASRSDVNCFPQGLKLSFFLQICKRFAFKGCQFKCTVRVGDV